MKYTLKLSVFSSNSMIIDEFGTLDEVYEAINHFKLLVDSMNDKEDGVSITIINNQTPQYTTT